jgi:hypothetical protein
LPLAGVSAAANPPVDQEWLGKVAARFKRVYEGLNVAKRLDTTHRSQTEAGEAVLSICRNYFQEHRMGAAE